MVFGVPAVLFGKVGGTVYYLAEPTAVVIVVRAIVNGYAGCAAKGAGHRIIDINVHEWTAR